jgi:hypothetical protein
MMPASETARRFPLLRSISYDPVSIRDVLACWTRSRLFGLFVCHCATIARRVYLFPGHCATIARRVYLFPVLLGCSARNEKFAWSLRFGPTATGEKHACLRE